MTRFPDLTGMTEEEARDILRREYPDAKYDMIYYFPPKVKDPAIGSAACRIIRQRLTNGRLEFTVSQFQNNE